MYFLISDCTQDQKNLDLEHFGTMHDGLTGIYNKYGFYRQARRVMDDNPHVEYLMVCLNFGDFKLLNGLYGMTKGNELLMRVGSMLPTLRAGPAHGLRAHPRGPLRDDDPGGDL